MKKSDSSTDPSAFLFTANRQPLFLPVMAIICASFVLIGFLFLPSPLGVVFIGAGLLCFILCLNSVRKNPYRSVSFDGHTIRVQDSWKQVRTTAITEVSKAEFAEDALLVRFKTGRHWEVGFGWLSEEDQKRIADLINEAIAGR